MLSIQNMQPSLNLSLLITCDKTQIKAYKVHRKNISSVLFIKTEAFDFSCGDKLIVRSNEAGEVILIQNISSSNVTYLLQEYVDSSNWQEITSSSGAIIALVIVLVVFGALGAIFYFRRKRLQEQLARHNANNPLIE